jgi:hypothetical protein
MRGGKDGAHKVEKKKKKEKKIIAKEAGRLALGATRTLRGPTTQGMTTMVRCYEPQMTTYDLHSLRQATNIGLLSTLLRGNMSHVTCTNHQGHNLMPPYGRQTRSSAKNSHNTEEK